MKKLCKILDKQTSEDPLVHCASARLLATPAIMAKNILLPAAFVSPPDVSPKNVSRCEIDLTTQSRAECPLCPGCYRIGALPRSDVMGQLLPFAVQQKGSLFDHLVGAGVQHRRDVDAERLGGLKIDDQLKRRRLHDR